MKVLHTYIHPCCKDEDVTPPPLYETARHEVWTTRCGHPEAPPPEDTRTNEVDSLHTIHGIEEDGQYLNLLGRLCLSVPT